MADLPPSIGFEDEPVILLRYTTLDDSLLENKKLLSKGRNRVKSDSSITNAMSSNYRKRNNKSSVSSMSDGSSFDMNDSERLPLSKDPSDHSIQTSTKEPKHLLKSLEEEEGKRERENGRHSKNRDDKGTRSCSQESSSSSSLSSPTKSGLNNKRKKSFSIEVEPSVVINLEKELASRETEIANLRRQLRETNTRNSPPQISILGPDHREEIDTELGPEHREISVLGPEKRQIRPQNSSERVQIEPLGPDLRETNSEPMFNSYRTTLHRLLDEQQISTRLKSENTELRIKVVTLEREVDRLHAQNLVQLQQIEQATTSLAAFNSSAHSVTSATAAKPKKKSFFGLRRSGRKGSAGIGSGGGNGSKNSSESRSSIEASPQLQRPAHSSSHLSLEGSFSEHDISSLLTRKSVGASPSNGGGGVLNSIDGEVLQSKLRLSMEEKAELARQLDSLKDELKHQEERVEELARNSIEKNEFLSVVVQLEETQQALALLTREKELVESETEGLRYELETLRGERDNLMSSLKGKEVKAVLKEKQEMDFLRSENKALMSEVRTLINNSDGLETSLSQLKREMVARDVRGHELKLKIKRLDAENLKLKTEMASLREDLNSAQQREALVSPTSSKFQTPLKGSPPRKTVNDVVTLTPPTPSSSSSCPSSTSSPNKTAIVKPVQQFPSIAISAAAKKSFHERAQSEDLTAVNPVTTPLQMVRTSSGGTKFVAVQVTLPSLENAKVLDKSLSTPSLLKQENLLSSGDNKSKRKTSDSTLGTFVNSYSPSSPKPAVNSLVKMFETGNGGTSSPTTITEAMKEEQSGASFIIGSPFSESQNEAFIEEESCTDKPIVKAVMSSSKPPLAKSFKTRRLSSSSSINKEELQERKKSDDETRNRRKEEEAKKKEEMKERQKKEHEAKEKQRKEEKLKKEQEKSRKEQEAKEKRERQRREQETKEKERKEQEAKERERKEQEAKERERKEQETKERERKEKEAREKEKREQEEKERKATQERIRKEKREQEAKERLRLEKEAQEKKEQELKREEERRKREELMSDRSQTWPPKSEHILTTTPTTNTLPCNKPNESDTIKTTPLGIAKPKPPPTTSGKVRSGSQHQTPPTPDSSLTGVVANLRSSWEKKSQSVATPTPHLPLVKTASVPYRMVPYTTPPTPPTQLQATVRPLVKTGSGPPGTIISSPSDQNKSQSPISLTRVSHMTPNHVTPPQFARVDSEPLLQGTQTTPTASATQQNGHLNFRRFPKASSVERSTSGSVGEVVLRNTPSTNGHASPRLSTRPASLYVSSNSSPSPTSPAFGTPTSEKRLSSLISKLQVKENTTTSTGNTIGTPSTVQQPTVSPILPRYTNTPNVKARSQSFQSSPKPLQRAVSLASPLDRRSKKTMLLRWCQLKTQEYDNVTICNFGESFSDGLAFCALLHHFIPEQIPFNTLDHVNQKRNFEIAFTVAESVGIPSLLDIDDMVEMAIPDWMSVMTYVSYIYNHFAKKE